MSKLLLLLALILGFVVSQDDECTGWEEYK